MRGRTGPISVCGLVPYPPDTAPSQRYRLEQWLPWLAADGVRVELLPFLDRGLMADLHRPGRPVRKLLGGGAAFARRLTHLARIPNYDAVLVHRTLAIAGPPLLELVVRLFRRPVIFDFDDAIYRLHTSAANRRLAWLKSTRSTAVLCRASSHVVVGNAHLAEYARRYNRRVTVIPSSVDTDHYRPVDKPTGDRLVVGWTGSSTSQTHLEQFAPVLREVVSRLPVELRVHSDRPPVLPGVPFTWRPWSPRTEVEELGEFDIGLMPMPDDPWARGKGAMKALLYMATGIPTVCSPVGTNREVIRHGENGLLAAAPEDWVAHVRALVDCPALRRRLGAAGRRTVEERYSMRASAASLAGVVREVVGR